MAAINCNVHARKNGIYEMRNYLLSKDDLFLGEGGRYQILDAGAVLRMAFDTPDQLTGWAVVG